MFSVDNQDGIRNPDGSFFRVGQPLTNIASQNQADPNQLPLFGQFLDPRLEMPYTRQASIGWSHELTQSSVVTVDYVNNQGRDLNTRPRLNVRTEVERPRAVWSSLACSRTRWAPVPPAAAPRATTRR